MSRRKKRIKKHAPKPEQVAGEIVRAFIEAASFGLVTSEAK